MNTTTKILVYVFGFILTCLLGFYIIGLVKPSITYETTININRSTKQTWDVFTNEKLTKDWMIGFEKFEKIKGEPLSANSEFKIHLEEDGQKFIINEKVKNVIPNKLYEFELENGILKNHVKVELKETGPFSTELTSSNHVEAQNWFFRSLFVFFKSQFKEQDEQNLNALKKLVEMDPVVDTLL